MADHTHCGHETPDGTAVTVREGHESCDAIDGYRAAVNRWRYCPTCAERAKTTWDTYLDDDAAEDWWFSEGYRQWRERIMAELAGTPSA